MCSTCLESSDGTGCFNDNLFLKWLIDVSTTDLNKVVATSPTHVTYDEDEEKQNWCEEKLKNKGL